MKLTVFKSFLTAVTLASTTLVHAEEHKVKMLNSGEDGTMVFEPGYLSVEPGDTVTFMPVDPAHNTNAVLTPDGGQNWEGDINEKVSVTLNKEGVFVYQCNPHLALGMVGVIQVGEATNMDAAKSKAEELKGKMSTGKGRLDKYLSMVE